MVRAAAWWTRSTHLLWGRPLGFLHCALFFCTVFFAQSLCDCRSVPRRQLHLHSRSSNSHSLRSLLSKLFQAQRFIGKSISTFAYSLSSTACCPWSCCLKESPNSFCHSCCAYLFLFCGSWTSQVISHPIPGQAKKDLVSKWGKRRCV